MFVCHDASPPDVDCKSAVDWVKSVDKILNKSGQEVIDKSMARRKSGTFDIIGIENTNLQSLKDVFKVFSSKTFSSRNPPLQKIAKIANTGPQFLLGLG